MPLSAGTRLGPYEILASINAGEMGEVYRARDTKLHRDVSIKTLTPAAADDVGLRAQLLHDAKSLSGLNHPNIETIYGIQTAEVKGHPVEFIVAERNSSTPLKKLIGRRGLRLDTALRYAIQIADGLATAHNAGIVHGCLNPSVIGVNERGEIKIWDFGVYRLSEQHRADVQVQAAGVQLKSGVSTENIGYLSPEQVEGRPADERSDIFAFGALLYEMISGHQAFRSQMQFETVASSLGDGPRHLNGALDSVPPELASTIKRCLRKNPRDRWQSISSLKFRLEDFANDVAQLEPVAMPRTKWRVLQLAVLSAILLAIAGGAYFWFQTLVRPHATYQRLTFRRGNVAGARFAPNGEVLFSAQWGTDPITLFSMRPGRSESRPLGVPAARVLSVSATGELAMLLGSPERGAPGTLARAPFSGGEPRSILENVYDADWSPSGEMLAVSHTVGGHPRIEYPIGRVLYESPSRPPFTLRVSPKGDLLAFFEYDNAIGDFALATLDLQGNKKILSRGWREEDGLVLARKGQEIWYSGTRTGGERAIHAVDLFGHDRIVGVVPAAMALQDITHDGQVLATVEDSRLGILCLSSGATKERDLSWFDASRIYDISADGKQILFAEMTYGRLRNPAIYLRNTDGSSAVRLGDCNRPALSPDNKWVACITSDGANTALTLLPTGPGQVRTLLGARIHYDRVEWFPDSQRILFLGSEPGRPPRIFEQEINGGKAVPVTSEGMDASHVSLDQSNLLKLANGVLTLVPIRGGKSKPIASLEPNESVIRWGEQSRFLFLRKSNGPASVIVERLDLTTGSKEPWKVLRTPDTVGEQINQVVLTPSGNAYAYSYQQDSSTLYLVRGWR